MLYSLYSCVTHALLLLLDPADTDALSPEPAGYHLYVVAVVKREQSVSKASQSKSKSQPPETVGHALLALFALLMLNSRFTTGTYSLYYWYYIQVILNVLPPETGGMVGVDKTGFY